MLNWEIRNARLDDIGALVPSIRQADADEVKALGLELSRSLKNSIQYSEFSKTVTVDGQIAIMFGCLNRCVMSKQGMPWFLTTEIVTNNKIWFARNTKRLMALYFYGFNHLENIVDARYTESIKWLKWLGFTVEEPYTAGDGYQFHKFWIKEFV